MLIILNGFLMEWMAQKWNPEIHQKIMYGIPENAFLVIISLVLVVTLPAFFISALDRFVTKESRIKAFLISSIVIFLFWGTVFWNSILPG